MSSANKRVKQIVYRMCLGINQLIDKGYSENPDDIANKVFEGELVEYIITKFQNEEIREFEFTHLDKEGFPEVAELVRKCEAVATNYCKYFGINNNGLILANSVFSNVLYDEF